MKLASFKTLNWSEISTLPLKEISPSNSIWFLKIQSSLISHLSLSLSNNIGLKCWFLSLTSIPPYLMIAWLAFIVIILSLISTAVLFTIVSVPRTTKSPLIKTLPELSGKSGKTGSKNRSGGP